MKVLLINKFFHPRGGSEAAFFLTARVLERHGHRPIYFSMSHPDNLESPQNKFFVRPVDFEGPAGPLRSLQAAGRVIYSLEARRRLSALLHEERPDIAHLHNIHHQLSPSILHALRRHGVPVVMTLHDYKVVCPAYTLFVRGRLCEKCRGGRFYHCLFRRCTKGSITKSLINMIEMYLHQDILRTQALVDLYISPSRFLRDKVAGMGFRAETIVLPNGLDLDGYPASPGPGPERLVYFGRLSPEKGLHTLLSALAETRIPCTIIGRGPLEAELRERCRRESLDRVTFRGHLPSADLVTEIRQARAVVVPSLWYENNPYNVLEAFALARPVIASRIGGLPELVVDGRTGWTVTPGSVEELGRKMTDVLSAPAEAERMGREARRSVETTNDAELYYRGLMNAYDRVLGAEA